MNSHITRLYEIIQSFRFSLDALEIADRVLDQTLLGSNLSLVSRTGFVSSTSEEAREFIQNARQSLDDSTVMAQWGIFEDFILNYVKDNLDEILEWEPVEFADRLHSLLLQKYSRWRIEEVIDLFELSWGKDLTTRVHETCKYRNWIAHGKKGAPPVLSDAQSTFERLRLAIQGIQE
jgi:hypothetical protein